jgi:ABC-type transporter Mla subunit MlaD
MIGLMITTGLAIFWFSVGRPDRVPYELFTDGDVMGLRIHAAVRYRGVDVGDVRSIHLDSAHPGRIAIHILVNRDTPVTHSTFGRIEFQGVIGIRFVPLDDTGERSGAAAFVSKLRGAKPVATGPFRPVTGTRCRAGTRARRCHQSLRQ